ncbi:MAG: hypothetical protein LBU72_00355 [Burkholderiaceae bacterium]|jgi:hypothetical protein|nr:hypothetical protein [Burkholderiaceae bacterium]
MILRAISIIATAPHGAMPSTYMLFPGNTVQIGGAALRGGTIDLHRWEGWRLRQPLKCRPLNMTEYRIHTKTRKSITNYKESVNQ